MTIQQINTNLPVVSFQQASAPAEPSKSLVERIVDKTVLSANFLASGLSGGIAGTGAYAQSVVPATVGGIASGFTNLWKAETVGPNLKVIGSALLLPAAALAVAVALPISLGAGIFHGADQVDSSKPREFTVGAAGVQGYKKTRAGWEKATNALREGFQEMGSEKLKEGEKPVDIPIIKSAKTLAMGAAAIAVGGVAGAMCAIVSTGRQVATGIAHAFTDSTLNLPGKVLAAGGAVIGGVAQGATFGATSALSIAGKGIGETWKKDSIVEGARATMNRATQSVAAAASPESLLQPEAPPPAQPAP